MDRLRDTAARLHAGPGRRLRILLSAYACEPGVGSEPGIGWRWALNLAAAGHEVHVITRGNNRGRIEAALASHPAAGVHFAYYDLPAWARWWKKGGRGVHLYYFLWQWGAWRVARHLCRQHRFDLVHHITFGVFRQPSFLGFLGLPFVFGPVGGGERAPWRLRRGLPLGGRLADLARDAANGLVRLDPLLNAMLARSDVVLCKTPETLATLPRRHRHKCRLLLEIGCDGTGRTDVRRAAGELRLLYVGRLVPIKGVHLALAAFARLLHRHPGARFTVVGDGPERPRLQRIAESLDITHAIEWRSWLPREEVMALYPEHDVFLFPSLHDSSGNAVLEALASGVPVVCLNLGGPAVLVDDSCGMRVTARSEEEAVMGLAHALLALADDPRRRARMARAAAARARREYSWAAQTERMNRIYAEVLQKRAIREVV